MKNDIVIEATNTGLNLPEGTRLDLVNSDGEVIYSDATLVTHLFAAISKQVIKQLFSSVKPIG